MRVRRGALRVPDLYAFLTPPTVGESASLDLEVRVPEGSWFDVIVDADRDRRTVIRLAAKPGESWVADVRDSASDAPVERPLQLPAGCLAGRTTVKLVFSSDSIRLRVGACPEVVADRTGGAGRTGLAAGLGGLEVWRFESKGSATEPYQLLAASPAARFALCGVVASVAVALVVMKRRWSRRRDRAPPSTVLPPAWARVLAHVALLIAVLPIVPWAACALALGVASLASRERRTETPDLASTEGERPRSWAIVVLQSLLAGGAIASWILPVLIHPRPDSTPEIAAFRTEGPVSWSPASEPAQGGDRATTLDVDLLEDGAVAAYVDAPATEPGTPLRPLLYGDLGSMAPGVVVERSGERLDWALVAGDLARAAGSAPVGPLRLTHRAGGVELSDGTKVLARISGLPARSGRVRILPVLARPAVRVEIRRPWTGLLFQRLLAFLVPLGGLVLAREVVRRTPWVGSLAASVVWPVLGAWFAVAVCAAVGAPDLPVLTASILVPIACISAPFVAAVKLVRRRRMTGGAIAGALLVALAAPNLLLAVAGGLGASRFTHSWVGATSSRAITGYLDPEQRLFTDTSLTGRYRQVEDEGTAPGGKRVLVLGGSQTYGEGFTGSPHSRIWTERIGAAHPDWNLVNLAVQGSTLASQSVRLRHYLDVHPGERIDAIVAVFGLNDLAYLRATPARAARIDAIRRGEISPFAADPCAFVAACSGARWIGRLVPFLLGRRMGTAAEKLQTVEWALAELDGTARVQGAVLALVREPDQCDLTPCEGAITAYDYPTGFDAVRPALDELGRHPEVRLCDPRPWLRARRATQPFFDAVHFSEAGHRAMAGALEPVLVDALR